MYIADTLSRAPEDNVDINTLKYCNYASTLAVSPNRLKRIQISTENDNTSRVLKELTISGWPHRSKIPIDVLEYYSIRTSITTNEKLLYKEDKLIVPKDLTVEMINLAHANHGGIGACLRRLREVMYWPGMSKQMTNAIKKCETCSKFAINNKGNQELKQHNIGDHLGRKYE